MRGLVPRWGRGGAWQNPPCQFAVPNHNSGFSHLGVPAPAGTSDSYENDATQPQKCLNATAPALVMPAPQSSFPRRACPVRRYGAGIQRGGGRQDRRSTSMPALHRRNVPNCRPMADGGMRKCSAGACPPLGSGWGVAESAVPIRCTKPQFPLFIPWCAGTSRHQRLVRK